MEFREGRREGKALFPPNQKDNANAKIWHLPFINIYYQSINLMSDVWKETKGSRLESLQNGRGDLSYVKIV